MTLKKINPNLRKKIFSEMNKLDNLAIKEYEKGNMEKGKFYENKSDKLYKENYNKMFVLVLDKPPKGWKKINGSTAPRGYEWYNNNKSRFGKDYKSVLVKKGLYKSK